MEENVDQRKVVSVKHGSLHTSVLSKQKVSKTFNIIDLATRLKLEQKRDVEDLQTYWIWQQFVTSGIMNEKQSSFPSSKLNDVDSRSVIPKSIPHTSFGGTTKEWISKFRV